MRADPDLRELADEEIAAAQTRLQQLEQELALLLVPRDPRDEGNLFLEVRAGTGGDEAAIFAGDLFRMYARYAERQGWKVEIESDNPGEHGGYKEVVARVVGRGAFSRLKFESGTHRVQRVPATESQGRIHTSAATVAIIPEADEVDDIVINPADLKVDTFRSSGAGGQHVNKTESAIRITHVPTGVVVECQTERSQHANRDKAMKRLKAQLLDAERQRQDAAQAESRRLQVGSGADHRPPRGRPDPVRPAQHPGRRPRHAAAAAQPRTPGRRPGPAVGGLSRVSAWQQRQHLQQAIARQPSDFVAWVMLADLELEAGDIAAGEQAARRALQLRPNHPEALARLGRVAWMAGAHADAATLLGQAAALAPQHPGIALRGGGVSTRARTDAVRAVHRRTTPGLAASPV
ncbi:hypothetical protein G6F31_014333 [Rhizopus arrhizus]|nr:hypothetical protein G6F31_014333 [Rhizopus arrhizus]